MMILTLISAQGFYDSPEMLASMRQLEAEHPGLKFAEGNQRFQRVKSKSDTVAIKFQCKFCDGTGALPVWRLQGGSVSEAFGGICASYLCRFEARMCGLSDHRYPWPALHPDFSIAYSQKKTMKAKKTVDIDGHLIVCEGAEPQFLEEVTV